MGTKEWEGLSELKKIYNGRETSFGNAVKQAGSSVPKREAIYRQRHEDITEFCQTQVVYANGKDAQAWLKETNLWLARKGKLKRELDGLVDKNDELPLPDRVKKNGKYVDIEYY
ncbi:hypothetical protein G6O67_007697 [Ophiocordyceps sinensis]|uniref:Uncharacterized protein n=2 Tax=Ophiocordyceps sinensis TaxID=72228 RepID=A0A8H4LUQ7_9HYPO|nr:hypothetical protein OCS_02811 [Ophiocordyceps sinensis CO18]KAF4505784.1 hypothetical protein G6O67_007697 [Ophiocordyceps sinensis]